MSEAVVGDDQAVLLHRAEDLARDRIGGAQRRVRAVDAGLQRQARAHRNAPLVLPAVCEPGTRGRCSRAR
jgi:hypothetical protein